MTIALPHKGDKEKVIDLLREPSGKSVFFSLVVGDLEYGDAIEEGEWGQDSSGAISADLTVGLRMAWRDDDAPSAFSIYVDGIRVPQMVGLVSLPQITEDQAATEFLGASAKAEAARSKLGELKQYSGEPPDSVIRDAMNRLPYAQGYTDIRSLKTPLLYYDVAHQNPFWPENTVADIFSAVEEDTTYRIFDNVYGGGVATPAMEISATVEPWREYNANDFIKWRPPPRKERRYSSVVVFARGEDGNDIFEPQRAEVYYRWQTYAPLPNASLWIELDDRGDNAPQRAKQLANDTARRLSRGVYGDDSVIFPYPDPLICVGDTFKVHEDWADVSGYWDRLWFCWVDTYKHSYDFYTEVSHSAALLEADLIQSPALAMGGVSGGVLKTLGAAVGYDLAGLWIRPEFALNTSNVAWAGTDGTGPWVEPDDSEGIAGTDIDGAWIEVETKGAGFLTWGDTTGPDLGDMTATFGSMG